MRLSLEVADSARRARLRGNACPERLDSSHLHQFAGGAEQVQTHCAMIDCAESASTAPCDAVARGEGCNCPRGAPAERALRLLVLGAGVDEPKVGRCAPPLGPESGTNMTTPWSACAVNRVSRAARSRCVAASTSSYGGYVVADGTRVQEELVAVRRVLSTLDRALLLDAGRDGACRIAQAKPMT